MIEEPCAAVIEQPSAVNKEPCAVNDCNNRIEKRFKSFEDVWVIYFKFSV